MSASFGMSGPPQPAWPSPRAGVPARRVLAVLPPGLDRVRCRRPYGSVELVGRPQDIRVWGGGKNPSGKAPGHPGRPTPLGPSHSGSGGRGPTTTGPVRPLPPRAHAAPAKAPEAAAGEVGRREDAIREHRVALHHPVGVEAGEQDFVSPHARGFRAHEDPI